MTPPFAAVSGSSTRGWSPPRRAVEKDPAAERFHAVFEADQAGAAGEVGAAAAVVADRDAQDAPATLNVDLTAEARACLAALVSASATT